MSEGSFPGWRDDLLRDLGTGGEPQPSSEGWTLDELTEDDGRILTERCARQQVLEKLPAVSSVRCVLGEVCEAPGSIIGRALAFERVGLLLSDMDVRWHLMREDDGEYLLGEVRRIGTVVLPPGHRWEGREGTCTMGSEADVQRAVRDDLVSALEPVVTSLRRLAKVGRGAMWDEVVDMVGLGITYIARDFDPAERDRLVEALTAPDAPWRRIPSLTAASTSQGPRAIYQKGGCCFAYQGENQRRPPPEPPDYCSTCRFRDVEDVTARQLIWHRDHRPASDPAVCENRPIAVAPADGQAQEDR